jgi:hypothetical protein
MVLATLPETEKSPSREWKPPAVCRIMLHSDRVRLPQMYQNDTYGGCRAVPTRVGNGLFYVECKPFEKRNLCYFSAADVGFFHIGTDNA